MMVFVPEYLPFMMFSSMMLPSTFDTPEKLAKNHERWTESARCLLCLGKHTNFGPPVRRLVFGNVLKVVIQNHDERI